jgi:hypothetical protein
MMADHASDPTRRSRRSFLRIGAAGLIGTSRLPKSSGQPRAAGQESITPVQPSTPAWAQDLIIYEIATKGFTSPNGPETGTFNSLKTRLPYLEELGITGIWLTGHSLADPHFFYNIWTQYANIEPQTIDPSLGTPDDFKSLIDEAHRHGIRVFLDVHVHGILGFSDLIKEHPHWFRGGSWHMADYDWLGGHPDLDGWWVNVWTDYVTRFGVDGYRLDFRMFRPDLWERIRQNAAAAGHEIVIFEEDDAVIPGVTDFTQHRHDMRVGKPNILNEALVRDVPGFYDRLFGKTGYYHVEIQYADDGSRAAGDTKGQGPLRVRLDGLIADKLCRRKNDLHADGIADVKLTVGNVASKPIEEVTVQDDMGQKWQLRWELNAQLVAMEGEPPTVTLYVATLAHGWPTVQLSCHDEGWEGFPADQSPYVACGSRSLFGYSVFFTPMIPIFFGGEEFNATYQPIPWLSAHLWDGQDRGKGRWLYGNMLDWENLNQPEHRAMFEDVKKMIAVRKREAAILGPAPDEKRPQLMAVPHETNVAVPVPYVRWNSRGAIIIAGNRDEKRDAHLTLRVPLSEMGLAGRPSYTVTELWPGGAPRSHSETDLAALTCVVNRDRTPGGGLRALKIEPRS